MLPSHRVVRSMDLGEATPGAFDAFPELLRPITLHPAGPWNQRYRPPKYSKLPVQWRDINMYTSRNRSRQARIQAGSDTDMTHHPGFQIRRSLGPRIARHANEGSP